jgi:Cdc6-like AAA superfamily ATPase
MVDDVPVPPTRLETPTASPAAAAAAITLDEEMKVIGDLSRKAATGSTAAREKLADKASINPEDFASAQRLGIDLPADVFSENYQVKSAAGLSRSQVASEAESLWNTTVQNAVNKADEIFARDIGATYVEGVPSVGVVSSNVLNTLKDSMETLKRSAVTVMNEVDALVPLSTQVQLNNLTDTLNKINVRSSPWRVVYSRKQAACHAG